MSYAFNVQAATKAEAQTLAEAEFDKVVAAQPIHARDKAAALANVEASLELITDELPEGQVYRVGVNGYVGWYDPSGQIAQADVPLNSIGVSVNVAIGLPFPSTPLGVLS